MARTEKDYPDGFAKHRAREQKRIDRQFAELRAATEESEEEPESWVEEMQLNKDTDDNEVGELEDDEDDELPPRAQVLQKKSRRRDRALENAAKHGGPAIPPRNILSRVVRPTAPSNPPKTAPPTTRLTRASREVNRHAHWSLGDHSNLQMHDDGVDSREAPFNPSACFIIASYQASEEVRTKPRRSSKEAERNSTSTTDLVPRPLSSTEEAEAGAGIAIVVTQTLPE
ncbi:hypothetical protein TI39_contig4187g00002 [Zymoseptoria brevis]|uniref:Uncharacterized protein n=1 Tax=Zymoseptoria brevis TaxID=1047168 RepID=A0A0F4GE92_9PEZI|nr:hypothetical protein TI39_contig4187g00002 [Zymoseptoria brevis]